MLLICQFEKKNKYKKFHIDFHSRSSDSSTPRSGNQGSRTGSTAASTNSPTTPATSTLASNVRMVFFKLIDLSSSAWQNWTNFIGTTSAKKDNIRLQSTKWSGREWGWWHCCFGHRPKGAFVGSTKFPVRFTRKR